MGGEATMSNINNFKKQTVDPFNKSVGLTYGDRVKYQRTQHGPSAPTPNVHKDQFKRPKEVSNIDLFDPKADYKAQRRVSSLYKPQILDGYENGIISKARENLVKPSDPALLNFLDRVIGSQATKKAAVRPTR